MIVVQWLRFSINLLTSNTSVSDVAMINPQYAVQEPAFRGLVWQAFEHFQNGHQLKKNCKTYINVIAWRRNKFICILYRCKSMERPFVMSWKSGVWIMKTSVRVITWLSGFKDILITLLSQNLPLSSPLTMFTTSCELLPQFLLDDEDGWVANEKHIVIIKTVRWKFSF